jgi:hypothetical protein
MVDILSVKSFAYANGLKKADECLVCWLVIV